MLRVNPILSAILQKINFGRTDFEPISLFEEHEALQDLKTILTVKKPNQTNKKSKQNKKPPYMFALGHFKSDLLAVEDKKRGVSQHFWDFSAQNMGLGPLSLSQH